jgi:hypothetical protein
MASLVPIRWWALKGEATLDLPFCHGFSTARETCMDTVG